MGLTAALNIGRSALTASQVGLQVAGNNMANAATPGYSRQLAHLAPTRGGFDQSGAYLGRGVSVQDVQRQVSEALQARVREGRAGEAEANTRLEIFAGVEATLNELTGFDLSTQINGFFNSWSELSNLVESSAIVVQQGQQLSQYIQQLRDDLVSQRSAIDTRLGSAAEQAAVMLEQVAALNGEIASAEVGGSQASALRDQRDILLEELSVMIDVTVVEQPDGLVDVLVGSEPVIQGGLNRGIELKRETTPDGELQVTLVTSDKQRRLPVTSGELGALLDTRENAVSSTIDTLNDLASQLIFEVNKLHATGANPEGLRTTQAQVRLAPGDTALALNDPLNASMQRLGVEPRNGGFLVHVSNTTTGTTETVRIDVDLDGIDNTGQRGFGDDTSLEDIRAALDAIEGVTARINPDGRLQIDGDAGFEFTLAEDSSDTLAVLGVNAYFTGQNASDINVREDLAANPSVLSTGRFENGTFVENGTALAIANMLDADIEGLGNRSFRRAWADEVQQVAGETATAGVRADASQVVRESIEAQRAAVSGVSIDEESMDLLTYQRQYQGAAQYISIVDEMMQTILSIL